jgi:hypothetical protein
MRLKSLNKFFSIVFVLATMMGVFHHHDDLKPHTECQICTIQSSIADADTPSQTLYLSKIEFFSASTASQFPNNHAYKQLITFKARAPPVFS